VAKLPTKADLTAADYGVAPENPKEQATAFFRNHLNTARSDLAVEFEGECYKGWWRCSSQDSANPKEFCFGWKLEAKATVKDTGGRPGDIRPYTFCFRDGKLIDVLGYFSRLSLPPSRRRP
jgi:hypothetical protein